MFRGKNVIITGGSSGIGERLAHRLAGEGARLCLIARDREKLERVRQEIIAEAAGAEVTIKSCDVSQAPEVDAAFAEIVATMGPPDYLINSAGVLLGEYFEKTTRADFRSLMDINFFGTLHTIQAALPHLKTRQGHIVNISSIAGVMGVFGYSAYCASKHAIVGLTDTLRGELRYAGVSVHLVLPPETPTPMVDKLNQSRPLENKMICAAGTILPVEKVVDDILRGLAHNRYLIITGFVPRQLALLNRLSPALGRFIHDQVVKKHYRGPG